MASRNQIAEIPVGRLGLNASADVSNMSVGYLTIARNISFASGALEKESGADKYNDTALDDGSDPVIVRQGHDWWPEFTKQRMIVVLSDGTVRRDEGGGTFPDTIKSSLDDAEAPYFVDGGLEASGQNRKLFLFTGANQVQVLSGDGTSMSDLSSPPADWSSAFPKVGVIHEGRMWGAGNANDPHRLYYTTIDDHEDFTGGGSLSVYPGFGQRITAMASFKGFLIVWKDPRGMYVVDTADGTPSNWRVFQSTDSVGCLSAHLVQHVQDGIAFLDHVANLWFLSAVDATGNVAIERPLPERQIATYVRNNINFGENASKARMAWYPNKMELHIALAGTGSTINNRDIVLDLNGDMPRFRVNERDVMMSLFRRDERGIEKPVFGNDAGFIYLMDRESREKDDAGYEARFRTPPFDFSHADPQLATIDKNAQFLEIAMQPLGDWTLTVDLIWDGAITDTVTFNLGSNQAVLGQFVLGTDELSGEQVANKKARILGSGRRLELDGHNSGKGQNFSLSRFFIHYTPGAP